MVENFNDEQLNLIAPALDVPYWIRHFKKTPADIELVKEICREADIE